MRIVIPLLALLLAFLMVQLAEHSYFYSGHEIVGNTFSVDRTQDQLISLSIVVGVIFVFVFYWVKFNDWAGEGMAPAGFHPRPTRHYTTSVRYLFWNGFYGMLMAAAYLILVYFPEPVYRLLESYIDAAKSGNASVPSGADLFLKIGDGYGSELLWPKERLAPYAAILMTVVWSGVRPFSLFEQRIRLHWQELAAIPSQARQLVETFEKEEDSFSPDRQVVSKVIKHLSHRPLTPEDFYDTGDSLWFLYGRLAYLNYLFQKYNRSAVFSRLAERFGNDFRNFEERVRNLHERILQRIDDVQNLLPEAQEAQATPQIENIKAQRNKNDVQPTLKNMETWLQDYPEKANISQQRYFERQEEELREEIEAATKDVVQFIVCGVLAVGNSLNQRRDLLEAFGFKQQHKISIPLDLATLTKVAAIALGITLVCSTVYYWFVHDKTIIDTPAPQDPAGILYWSVIACIMHLMAIIASYFTQCSMETQRRHQMVKEPEQLSPGDQVAEGLWAACVGFSLNVVLMGILSASAGQSERLVQNWWWALVPGVTAFFAALYTQKIQRPSKQMLKLFWGQGILTGLMATMVCLVTQQLDLVSAFEVLWDGNGNNPPNYLYAETEISVAFWLYVTATTTALGLALAKILHNWVDAYNYSGKFERRQAKRKRPLWPLYLLNQRKWITDEGEQWVWPITFSDTGGELKTTHPLVSDSEGKITLKKGKTVQAKVIRSEKNSPNKCFVKILEETP